MTPLKGAVMGNLILNSLEIRNFRCFHHLQIERLGRVNLIVGKNNIGKTALLQWHFRDVRALCELSYT